VNSDIEDGKFKPNAPDQQLYNLATDLSESTNVINQYPEVAEKMRQKLEEIRKAGSSR